VMKPSKLLIACFTSETRKFISWNHRTPCRQSWNYLQRQFTPVI